MTKRETIIQQRIQSWVKDQEGVCSKTHGSQFSKKGEADLWGAVPVGKNLFVHFAVEAKDPDDVKKESKIQNFRLEEWAKRGYATGVVASVKDMKAFLKWAWKNGIGLSKSMTEQGVWKYYEQ